MEFNEHGIRIAHVFKCVRYDPKLKQFFDRKTNRLLTTNRIKIFGRSILRDRLAHFYVTGEWPNFNRVFKPLENYEPKRTQSGVIHRISGKTLDNRPKPVKEQEYVIPVFGKSE